MLAIAVTTTVAWVIFGVIVAGWLLYAWTNIRSGKREAGSEIDLAPNRKPGLPDEELEGPKLEQTQLIGVLLLVVITVALPLYWVLEPDRQAGADRGFEGRFASRGAGLFATTAEGGFNCAGCHGGMAATGGAAPYTITDSRTGDVQPVSWIAPALDTALYRYSDDEVRFILNYGRPFSPMSPWGLVGGGPMNEQQIQNVIDYMRSIQLPPVGCAEGEAAFDPDADPAICADGFLPDDVRADIEAAKANYLAENPGVSEGEALYNLDLAGGAYSCARCHTFGWSWGDPQNAGSGALGWNLTGGGTNLHFSTQQELVEFLKAGSQVGKQYGNQGQGSGRMPGFGHYYTDDEINAIAEYVRSL